MDSEITISRHEVRRSFALGVFNGAVFEFAERLIDPPLVLTWFVSQLTSSNLLIGLVTPLGDAGWFLPQVFISPLVQRMERKMPSYTASAVARAASWLLLAAAVWLVARPGLLLAAFFVLYSAARLAAGLAGLAFFDVVAKTIPARRRGSFFAWRLLLGGLLGIVSGWIVSRLLEAPGFTFPRSYALLFLLYCAAAVPAMAAFIAIREPPGVTVHERMTLGQQLRRAGGLLRRDPVFRRYMLTRLALALAGIAVPFYAVYAQQVLRAPEGMVGIYLMTRIGAQLLFNLPWGRLSDRHGNRLTMLLSTLGSGLTPLIALALVAATALLRLEGNWLPYLAIPVFLLDGAVRPSLVLVDSNFLLELAPEAERPLYLGLSNTLIGVAVLLSGMGGLVVDLCGFAGLFLLAAGLCILAHLWARGLPEPRRS